MAESPKSAMETDLMENKVSEVPLRGKIIRMPIRGHEIKTVRIAV
jgi:hypothetical protein